MSHYTCLSCSASFELDPEEPGTKRIRCFNCVPRSHKMRDVVCAYCGRESRVRSGEHCSFVCRDLHKGPDCAVCGERVRWFSGIKMDGSAMHKTCKSKRHGTEGSYRRGCRCRPCKDAIAEKMRVYVRRVRERDGITPSARYKRQKRDQPVEVLVCAVCGDPVRLGREPGAVPVHKRCAGRVYISPAVRRAVYERDDWMCHLCGEAVDVDADPLSDWFPSIDHIVPRSLGGDDSEENCSTAHRWCNSARGNMPVEEFSVSA